MKPALPVARAEGIDGRVLETAEDGTVPVPDGLVYVWLDPQALGDRLQTDTPAMRLWSIRHAEPPRPKAPSPVVLRYQFDTDVVEAKSEGYRVKAQPPGKVSLTVRVFNFSEDPLDLKLEAWLEHGLRPPNRSRTAIPDPRAVSVPPESFVDVGWELDLGEAFAATGHAAVEVLAADAASNRVASLAIDLSGE